MEQIILFIRDEYSKPLNYWILIISITFTIGLCVYFRKDQQNKRDVLSYLPNIWTSLGILGTFIAIVSSLYNIQYQSDDTIDIIKLIEAIIPAFTTSIIGIIGAIISSICIKIVFARKDQIDDNKKDTPEYILRNIEALLITNIEETISQSQRITDTLINQSAILKTFIDDFVKRMDEIFINMKTSIEEQTRQFGIKQFKDASEIMEGIIKKLTKVEGEIINAHINTIQQTIENTNQQFEGLSNKLLDSVKENITSFNEYILEMANRLREEHEFINAHTAQIVENYNQSALSYKDAVQNAHDQNENVSTLLKTMGQSMENYNAINQKVIETLDLLQSRQEKINKLVIDIQKMSVAIESLQRLESLLNKLNR
jgi:cytochrome c556